MANLPTSLFEDIAFLNQDSAPPLATQRASGRHPYHAEAVVTLPGKSPSGRADDVVVHDISQGGISFTSPHALKPGQKFSIWLKRRRGTLVGIECFVEHCDKAKPRPSPNPADAPAPEPKGYFVGSSFVRIIQAESVHG
jgi:hypothetical protein